MPMPILAHISLVIAGWAVVANGVATAGPIDERFRDPGFDAYAQGPSHEARPGGEVRLDDRARFTLPPSAFDQQVRMVKRLGHGSVEGDDRLIVGVQLDDGDYTRYAATLLYEQVDGRFQLETILPMRERFTRFRLRYSQDMQRRLLILRGVSGAHFHEAWIYDFGTRPPRLLAANGSAAGVEIRHESPSDAPQLWVGVADWSDPDWNYATGKRLWNVYTWQDDQYAYDGGLSTVARKPVASRMEEFIDRIQQQE
jgi:hypothetical protein